MCGVSKALHLSLLWIIWRDRMSWVRQGTRKKDTRVRKTAQELFIVWVSHDVEIYVAILMEWFSVLGLTSQEILK